MFRFRLDKTIQAVALLLQDDHVDQSSYLKLLKLLYIADRESLKETGRPITGDRAVAMEHGPVLSHLYDLIKGEDSREEWTRFFRTDGSFRVQAVADPGTDKLCKYEVEKLREVSTRYAECSRWQLRDETHKLPEWQKNDPGKSVRPIPLEDILEAVDRADALSTIEQDAREDVKFARLFGD
jgi:uncharacterized phage-associated protein